MSDRDPTTPHLHLVPTATADQREAAARAGHPSSQPLLDPVEEVVFEWHGLVEHERLETPCCHTSIEVTNLVGDRNHITHDVVAVLSTVLHGWEGWDVMVLVTVTPPTGAGLGMPPDGPVWPCEPR